MRKKHLEIKANQQPLRILFLEDCHTDVEICLRTLKNAGFTLHVDVVSTYADFAEKLDSSAYDIVLADYQLPQWTGLKALELLQERRKNIPFILVTGRLEDGAAVNLIQRGADDYILKDRLGRLPVAVHRVIRERRLIEARKRAEDERERLINQLRESAEEVKRLNGLLPICVSCKRILDAKGHWHNVEIYIQRHSRGNVSPSMCPECSYRIYPEYFQQQFRFRRIHE